MNTCKVLSNFFSAYVERSIEKGDKKKLEIHLTECCECQARVSHMKTLRAKLQSLPQMTASSDFEAALRTQIRLERRACVPYLLNKRIQVGRLASYSVAGVLFLVSLTYFLWQDQTNLSEGQTTIIRIPHATELLENYSPSSLSAKILYTLDKISPSQLQRINNLDTRSLNHIIKSLSDSSGFDPSQQIESHFNYSKTLSF